ncbi:MAG: SRPBCC family protein [Candidatus Aramenus sp.]|nr:SRPBCC family protein [Candidatus Aramenus sp.]
MEEVTRLIEVRTDVDEVMKFLENPYNLLKYVPHFKELRKLKEDEWELTVSWVFTVSLVVTREIRKNEVVYYVKKSLGPLKLDSSLKFSLKPVGHETFVELTWKYEGPFEALAKKVAEELYVDGVERFKREVERARVAEEARREVKGKGGGKKMKERKLDRFTLELSAVTGEPLVVNREELDELVLMVLELSFSMPLRLTLDDGTHVVELRIDEGGIVQRVGEMDSLQGEIKVKVMKDVR